MKPNLLLDGAVTFLGLVGFLVNAEAASPQKAGPDCREAPASASAQALANDLRGVGAALSPKRKQWLRRQFDKAKPVTLEALRPGQTWKCQHHNAFENDDYLEKNVTMKFASGNSGVITNSGNFVIKELRMEPGGLTGEMAIHEYGGIVLSGVLRVGAKGELIGEVSVKPSDLPALASHYRHAPFKAVRSLRDSSKAVFYYTRCKRLAP